MAFMCFFFVYPPAYAATPTYTEDYIYDGKTIRIQYYDATLEDTPENIARIRTDIRTGLIDRGLLSSWIKQELPSTSILWLEYAGSGTYKDVYLARYFHPSNLAGHTLVVGRTDYIPPVTVTEQYNNVLIPCDEFWTDEALKPIARPGGVVVIDAEGREVYTMEFIEGLNRKQYYDKLNSLYRSFYTTNQASIILRKESSILWMIWKATGGVGASDLHNGNSIYTISPLAANKISRAKFFDFDYLAFSLTFEEFYRDSALALRGKIYDDLFVAGDPPSKANILLGFYRGARLAGQTKEQIFADWDLLASAYQQEVAEAKALVGKIRTINWVEGLADEASSIKTYARAKIEDALFLRDLLESICIESAIIETDISKIYGAFGMAGEYTYEYFMAVKMSDGKSYFFDAGVLKEGLDPAGYNMKSVVNLRQSLHAQDPSLTGSSFGAVDTDAGIPVEARQHDKFGMNSPPAVPPEEVLDQEIIDWWAEKYGADAEEVSLLDALAISDMYDADVPPATLEVISGVSQQALLNMILDVHTITGTYPEVFEPSIDTTIYKYKLSHFDAYTIWFKSYNLGKPNEEISKEYDIPLSTVITLVDYVTAKVVPVNTIEQRVRSEWLGYFDAIKAIAVFDPFNKYYEKIAKEIHIPHIKGNYLTPFSLRDLNGRLGVSEDWTRRFKLSNPALGQELADLDRANVAKTMAFEKRIFPLLYNGFYAKVSINRLSGTSPKRAITLDPYDKFEALGVLADIGADGKALIERASGFTKDEINAILIEKWYYQSGEATEYEITVQKNKTNQSRFLLHLQKKGQPGVQATYDNLVNLQSQSVYNKLSGVGTDSYTGRTAFATDKASYSTEADLIKRGVSKDAIKQYITRRLKILTGATQGFSDGCWVITDPAAIGFIDKGSGLYEARIADASKINKGVAVGDVSNYYKNDPKWQGYGIDLSVSGGAPEIEPYSFTENGISKTVQIDWFNELILSGDRGIIKAALIDNGMLRSWMGLTELPLNSFMTVEKLGVGSYKKIYRIFFGEKEGAYESEFVFGFVYEPTIPTDIQDQFDLMTNVRAEWASKVDKYLIPVPEPGMVMRIIDPYDNAVKEVFTREYLPDHNRRQFRDSLLNKLGNTAENYEYINKLLCRREAASLWMIWKATGKLVKDIGFFNLTNTLYIVSNLGLFIPKYADLDITYSAATFKDFFTEMRREFGIGYDPELILGFYDSMKLYGMTDAQISAELDILADVNSGAVKVVKSIITEGRPITWLDNPKEDEDVPYKTTQRRAAGKALIEGNYGFLPAFLHEFFTGNEDTTVISNIKGEYLYSNDARDYYEMIFDVSLNGVKGSKSVIISVSKNAPVATIDAFDARKTAITNLDEELGRTLFDKKDFEVKDQNNAVVYKKLTLEEPLEDPELFKSVFGKISPHDLKYQIYLKALSDLYATLYKATDITPVLGITKAVLSTPRKTIFSVNTDEEFTALPVDYAIQATSQPHEMIDYYLSAVPELKTNPDIFLKAVHLTLGKDFLIQAAAQSANAGIINNYLASLPKPGSIEELLYILGQPQNQAGFSAERDILLDRLKGKSINVGGNTYTWPLKLELPSEYEEMYNFIRAALGEEGYVGTIPTYSEEEIARNMKAVLSSPGYSPTAVEMQILRVAGIRSVDELKTLLDNYPYTTYKLDANGSPILDENGNPIEYYTLTPRKVLLLLIARDLQYISTETISSFSKTVEDLLKYGSYKDSVEPVAELFLTEEDFVTLNDINKKNGLLKYPSGLYDKDLNMFSAKAPAAYLHELSHAQQYYNLDLLGIRGIGRSVDVLNMHEGHAQTLMAKKLRHIHNVLGAQLGAAYWGSDEIGFFGLLADGTNTFSDFSSEVLNGLNAIGIGYSNGYYSKETNIYRLAEERYGSEDVLYAYLVKSSASPAGLSLDDFLDRYRPHYAIRSPSGKVVAVSDVHGGYYQLVSTLINAGIIKKGGALGDPNIFEIPTHIPNEPLHRYTYTGGNSLLIFLGDSINKGEYSYEVRMLIGMLKRKTEVIELWGNHEAYLFEAAHINDNAPNFFGLKSKLNILQQLSTTDAIAAFIQQLLYKTDSPRASLEDLLDDSAVSSARNTDYMLSGILEEMLKDLKTLAKVTMANGDSYLFIHASITKRAWDKIKNEGSPEAILYKFNELVLTDPELFWDIINSAPEDWINDPELIADICNKLKVKYIVVGHYNHMNWQKPPDKIGFTGPEVGGFKRIIGINTIMSPGLAVGELPVQGWALVINPDGTRQYISSDVFPSPVVKNPSRFNFLKSGQVEVIGKDGAKATIHRKVFRDWYCGQGELYSFPNESGFLDLKEDIGAEYVVKGRKISLSPEFTLFPGELGLSFHFIGYPNAIEMYYLDKRIGRATFVLQDNGNKMYMDTFRIEEGLLPADLIKPKEVARGLLIKAYKLNDKVTRIAGKIWPLIDGKDPMQLLWDAFDTLGPSGNKYLSAPGDISDFRFCDVLDIRLKDASFILPEGGIFLPGDTVISGTPDAPSLVRGGVPVIKDGIIPKDTKIELSKGDELKITTPKETHIIPVKELLDLIEQSFGAGVRQLNVKLEGTDHIISLKEGEVTSGGVRYDLRCHSPCPSFWAEQAEYYENKVQKFRWETGYRTTEGVSIPHEFKTSYMIETDMIALTHGRSTELYDFEYQDRKQGLLRPKTRRLVSHGILPTDLEIAFVKVGPNGIRSAVYVPYSEFVGTVLSSLPEATAFTHPRLGEGYFLELPKGNKVWFSKNINDPVVFGEGPMFKNIFGGYNVDGIKYISELRLLSADFMEFMLFPHFPNGPAGSMVVYDVPVEPVVVRLGKDVVKPPYLFGANLYQRQTVGFTFSELGDEILIEQSYDFPTSKMKITAQELPYWLERALQNRAFLPLVFGGINTAVILIRYYKDENYTTDMFKADLAGNAAFVGSWWLGAEAVTYLANKAVSAGGLARLGISGLSISILPISIAATDFTSAFYTEISRAEDVDEKLLSLNTDLKTKATRAWFSVLEDWGNLWGILGEDPWIGGKTKQNIEYTVANALWDKELEKNFASYEKMTDEELKKAKDTFYLDNALPTGKRYSKMYEDEIFSAIEDALVVNRRGLAWTRYGRFQAGTFYNDDGSSQSVYFYEENPPDLPVKAEQAKTAITKSISPLYDKLLTGDGGVWIPIETIIGADVFESKYSLPMLFGLARQEVDDVKAFLEDKRDSRRKISRSEFEQSNEFPPSAFNVSYDLYNDLYYFFRYSRLGDGIGIFYDKAIERCGQIYSLLDDADFAGLDIGLSLVLNSSFENIADEYVSLKSYLVYPPYSGTTAPTTLTLPDDDIFDGIRYHWDLDAHNLSFGESAPSERWDFIAESPLVKFQESAPSNGFDFTTTPPWLIVPASGSNAFYAVMSSSVEFSKVDFFSDDSGIATVYPSTAASSKQLVTVTGISKGETTIRAKIGATEAAAIRVSVKDKRTVTVSIHLISDIAGHSTVVKPEDADEIINRMNSVFTPQANVVFVKHNVDSVVIPTDLGITIDLCVPEPTDETDEICNAVFDDTADINSYMAWFLTCSSIDFGGALAFAWHTNFYNAFIVSADIEGLLPSTRVLSHEAGHILLNGNAHRSSPPDALMGGGTKIMKNEVDIINP